MKNIPVFRRIIAAALVATCLALTAGRAAARAPAGELVVHEWGTFTSFQAADGVLLKWRTLTASGLPPFVIHYNRPGPGLEPLGDPILTPPKSDIYSLQRMETPVIYFYSQTDQTVDARVEFPKGLITEWYPAASQYGPSIPAKARDGLRSPDYAEGSDSRASLIRWSGLRVLGPREAADAGAHFASDKSGSHYFAARETEANPVLTVAGKSVAPECEKFLFYRGVGNFTTPLVASMPSDDSIVIQNKGKDKLAGVFIVSVSGRTAGFTEAGQLAAGDGKTVQLNFGDGESSKEQLEQKLGLAMKDALVAEGLYAREAEAMVKTWRDSWFGEDGIRVLYLLPRKWTDDTLPLQISPMPKEIVRVMLGRAEVLPPATERTLAALMPKVRDNDPAAAATVEQIFNTLGRFAEPVYERAVAGLRTPEMDQVVSRRLYAPLANVEAKLAKQ